VKATQRQQVVIAGPTAPGGTHPFFGTLVLAVREDDAWRCIGHIGTGFSHRTLEEPRGTRARYENDNHNSFASEQKDRN
jgi:bifunctional non-homologous end joining protein LigD